MDQPFNETLTISEFFQGIQIVVGDIKRGLTALKENLELFASAIQQGAGQMVPFILALQQEFPRFVVMQFSEDLITDHKFVSLEKRKIQGWNFKNWEELKITIVNTNTDPDSNHGNLACVVSPSTFTFVQYYDMDFCDKRKGKANTEWQLLEQISKEEISYEKTDSKTPPDRQRKHRLDKKLQHFFKIRKSAFEVESYRETYKPKFSLKYIKE